jgi:hypothetical protein
MPLFKRRRPDPPGWAGFLGPDGWHEFTELVRHETGRRGWPHDFALGITVHAGTTMHLTNLAQMCHGAPREEWTEIVARHFATLDETGRASFASAEQARAALRARLIDAEFVAGRAIPMAARRVGDDLDLALAYDLPDTVELPPREDVLAWGDEDELFELALEQTRAEPDLELARHDYGEEEAVGPTSVWLLTGDSFFTATHGLWAETFDPPASEHGTLVAVPNRHAVLAHPIRDFAVIGAVQVMLNLGHTLWTEGPGSMSDGLYWLRDGFLQRLETQTEGESTVFAPPDELFEILNGFE